MTECAAVMLAFDYVLIGACYSLGLATKFMRHGYGPASTRAMVLWAALWPVHPVAVRVRRYFVRRSLR